ncbi:MAG: hypothetical protein HRU34_07345 [Richelia sp.]|nr:hypothetical protein [Richelia sp.]CDN11403.1 hypothetical protein RintRC_3636 [Richelia intracellularis]
MQRQVLQQNMPIFFGISQSYTVSLAISETSLIYSKKVKLRTDKLPQAVAV